MARTLHKLTARRVATETKPGRHADGGGLYFSVDKEGRRRWTFMFARNGKQREIGLGSVRDVTLAQARTLASAARERLAAGQDPRSARREVGATFGECADELIKAMEPGWRNEKHADQWKMTLKVHAKSLRAMQVDAVSTADVLAVLKPMWTNTPETAARLRGRIERVLDAAKAQGLRSGENPARWRGHLDQLLAKRQVLSRGHHAAMPFVDVPAFVVALREREGVAARALEFALLTAARSGEVRGARWSEFDLDKAVWVVPPVRMKGGREHRVPLSDRAVTIVRAMDPDRSEYVFPGERRATLSDMSLSAVLRRMNLDCTVHGFRSSFRDWTAETTLFPNHVVEMALAHVVGDKVEAAYRRGDLFDKRRELINAWTEFCSQRK